MAVGRGGRDGRRSGAGKVDDGGDEVRGQDARIPVVGSKVCLEGGD